MEVRGESGRVSVALMEVGGGGMGGGEMPVEGWGGREGGREGGSLLWPAPSMEIELPVSILLPRRLPP
jgi:hypothetical protein